MERKNRIKILGFLGLAFGLGYFLFPVVKVDPSKFVEHKTKASSDFSSKVMKKKDGNRGPASKVRPRLPRRQLGSVIPSQFLPKKSDPHFKLGKGKTFAQVKILSAVKKENYQISLGPAVEEKAGFIIFDHKEVKEGFLPVVKRSGSPYLGVVTGLLKVKTESYEKALELASRHSLEFVHYDKSIGWAYFNERNFEKLTENLALLKADQGVEQAMAEVLEVPKVSK